MKYNSQRAQELLRLGTGIPDADFRDDQEEAIIHIVENRGRLLLVQKTGWGKSNVYFIATKLLREAGTGPALLISPLLSVQKACLHLHHPTKSHKVKFQELARLSLPSAR